ncbi:fatty acyl-AMP ligase [Desertibaculum subflavum]|uniref:fatty acyl-AMP ligase n=1 Tax=Desertibaculum subflavum TaxID=2268458 RepID=UPI000E671BB9
MLNPTPTDNTSLPRRLGDFPTIVAALDYAARGETGLNFHSARGDLAEVLTYARLRDEALDLAGRLAGLGLKPGDHVALVAETEADFARAFFACQYAGLAPAPLPLPQGFGGKQAYIDQLRGLMQACRPKAAIAHADLLGYVEAAADGLELLFLGNVATLANRPSVPVEHAAQPADVAYIQFSSGSTRFPMGIVVTQRALMANVIGITAHGLQVREQDRAVSWLPLYHDMGLVGFFLAALACQISVDLMATRDFARRPLLWLRLIGRNRGTLSYSPTFGYELCARRAETAPIDDIDLSSWRAAGIGADMIRPQVLNRFAETFARIGFRATALVPSYGLAETTLAVSFAPLDRGMLTDTVDLDRLEDEGIAAAPKGPNRRARSFVACGRPLPAHDVKLIDATGAAVGERRVGRVLTRGANLMQGYLDRPAETAAVLDGEGWLDTGDLGYWLGDQIVITGRAKDLIIVNGRNIWPQDLEWGAERAVGLRSGDVAAFAVDAGASGERVVLLVQCRASAAADRDDLRRKVANAVKDVAGVEGDVVLVAPHALPQTSSGKLSRSQAKRMFEQGAFAPAAGPSRAAAR